MNVRILICTLLCSTLPLAYAHATTDIKSPYVGPDGSWKFGHKGSWSHDAHDKELKNNQAYKFGLGKTIAPKWFIEVETGFNRASLEDFSLSSVEFEVKRQWTEAGDFWWDLGSRVNYVHRVESHEADSVDMIFMAQNSYSGFTTRLNAALVHDFGKKGEDIGIEAGAFVRYEISPYIKPGIEYQAEYGAIDEFAAQEEQGHLLGPALYGKLPLGEQHPVSYELAYLLGMTDTSPDGNLRWKLEYQFRF